MTRKGRHFAMYIYFNVRNGTFYMILYTLIELNGTFLSDATARKRDFRLEFPYPYNFATCLFLVH